MGAGILVREICALGKVRVLSIQIHHWLQQTIFKRTAALNSMRDGLMGDVFGHGDGSCIDWHQRHVVREFSALCHLAV